MTRWFTICFALVLAFPAPAVDRPSGQVVAELRLPYARVLSGVPLDLDLTVTNDSTKTATIGLVARLIVLSEGGIEEIAKRGVLLDPQPMVAFPPTSLELQPGETRQFSVPWISAATSWSPEVDYSSPGTYSVALELSTNIDAAGFSGVVRTSTATLTRTVPTSETGVAEKLLSANKGRWRDDVLFNSPAGRSVLDDLLAKGGDSAYYPYALALTRVYPRRVPPPTEEELASVASSADRYASSPAYPHLRLLPGEFALSLASDARRERRAIAAMRHLETAASAFEVAAQSPVGSVRTRAEEYLRRTRGEMESARRAAGMR